MVAAEHHKKMQLVSSSCGLVALGLTIAVHFFSSLPKQSAYAQAETRKAEIQRNKAIKNAEVKAAADELKVQRESDVAATQSLTVTGYKKSSKARPNFSVPPQIVTQIVPVTDEAGQCIGILDGETGVYQFKFYRDYQQVCNPKWVAREINNRIEEKKK